MSKLTVKACIHTINPFGFNQNEGKTEKTESRVHTRLDYAEVHPVFAGTAKTSLTLKNNYYCEASMMKNVFLVFPF